MLIEIDQNSGFCFGVVNAIKLAEKALEQTGELYCLGEIVHNTKEVERLQKKGLKTIDHTQLDSLAEKKVMFRAHGEPPSTYEKIKAHNIKLVDATCPVVLRLQMKVRQSYQKAKEVNGQIVIYGEKGHAEVNGLIGQTEGQAIVIENKQDLEKIDPTRPIYLFSQTTKGVTGLNELYKEIIARTGEQTSVEKNDTVCSQVSGRIPNLKEFSQKHNIILFVSSKSSSNGKLLHKICKEINPKSYFLSGPEDIDPNWFTENDSVGICGATSTPQWLMESVLQSLKNIECNFSTSK